MWACNMKLYFYVWVIRKIIILCVKMNFFFLFWIFKKQIVVKYFFLSLSLSLSLSLYIYIYIYVCVCVCVYVCVCMCARVRVHFKVISVIIGGDCHCKQGVVSIYYNDLNPKYLNWLYQDQGWLKKQYERVYIKVFLAFILLHWFWFARFMFILMDIYVLPYPDMKFGVCL